VKKGGGQCIYFRSFTHIIEFLMNIWWQLILIRSQIIIWSYLCDILCISFQYLPHIRINYVIEIVQYIYFILLIFLMCLLQVFNVLLILCNKHSSSISFFTHYLNKICFHGSQEDWNGQILGNVSFCKGHLKGNECSTFHVCIENVCTNNVFVCAIV
jgi:hypothetical protein